MPGLPSVAKVISSFSALRGETIVPCGAAAANALGLTNQVPIRSVYLTSGPDRRLRLGEQCVELRHAPIWKLVAPHKKGVTPFARWPGWDRRRSRSILLSFEVNSPSKISKYWRCRGR